MLSDECLSYSQAATAPQKVSPLDETLRLRGCGQEAPWLLYEAAGGDFHSEQDSAPLCGPCSAHAWKFPISHFNFLC